MGDLEKLIGMCKGAVHVEANGHRSVYETIREHLRRSGADVPEGMLVTMEGADCCIEVQAYPDTPVGFYIVVDVDLEAAIRRTIEAIEEERKGLK